MEVVPEVKTCGSCAKAKRKCGKESPRCHRCTSRGLECIYPLPTRPSAFVRLPDAAGSISAPLPVPAPVDELGRPQETCQWDPSVILSFGPPLQFDAVHPPPSAELELARPSGHLREYNGIPKKLTAHWFMSPESWKTQPHAPQCEDPALCSPFSRVALKTFLATGQRWMSDWISTGGNTFIHKQLYSFRLPRCVQDAYTAIALYLLRTGENEDMVSRTIQDRSAQLLRDEEGHSMSSSLDPLGHLSRVQALLVYQNICLLDGDIRLRALAEERTPVMMAWLGQMLESISFAAQLAAAGQGSAMTAARGLGLGIAEAMQVPSTIPVSTARAGWQPEEEEVLWHTWVFAESARRTWVFAQGLHAVYEVMRDGWTVCSDALMFTTASGVWDAPSSYAWSKICLERDVALKTLGEIENLLTDARAGEVDEYAKSLLEIMFGKAKVERWTDATA